MPEQKSLGLEENENEYSAKKNMHHRNEEKNKNNRNISQNNLRANNICFICKLPGHYAKECVLTRDTCYECGIKGHMAKECQAGVSLSHKQKFNIYLNAIKNEII